MVVILEEFSSEPLAPGEEHSYRMAPPPHPSLGRPPEPPAVCRPVCLHSRQTQRRVCAGPHKVGHSKAPLAWRKLHAQDRPVTASCPPSFYPPSLPPSISPSARPRGPGCPCSTSAGLGGDAAGARSCRELRPLSKTVFFFFCFSPQPSLMSNSGPAGTPL